MLTTIGIAAARRLRVGGAHSVCRTARVTLGASARSAVVIPSSIRIAAAFKKGFATARAAPKATKAAAALKKTTKKTTTTTTTKKATATKAKKKPAAAAKKKTTTRKTKKKAAPVKAKKKAKKVKKVLTDEEKQKLAVKKLREQALLKDQPSELPAASWSLFVAMGAKGDTNFKDDTKKWMQSRSAQYKALSAADLAALQATAKRNKAANEIALASWIGSKTEEEIRAANRARTRLRKLGFNSKFRLIDPRHVPKIQPYTVFFKERWSSGAFSNQVVTEAAKQIGREWKALSDAERENYKAHAVVA